VRLTKALIARHERLARDDVPIAEACRRTKIGTGAYYRWAKRGEAGENGLVAEFYERVVLRRRGGGLLSVDNADEWRSVDRFGDWASALVLDSGGTWELEPFQRAAAEDVLSGNFQAIWLLTPEGNAKTTWAAGLALYLLEHQLSAEIPVGAASIEQANVLYRQAEGFVRRTPGMVGRFKLVPGMRRIDSRVTHGHLRVYPADDRTADGVIPSTAFLDEGHRQRDMRLYRTWRGKWSKRQGPVVVTSTAGEPTSEFEELRQKIIREAPRVTRDGAYLRAEHDDVVLHDWSVRNRDRAEDMRVVKEANPLETISVESLQAKWAAPEMTPEHWLRFSCNIATRPTGVAVQPEEWDELCEDGLEPDRKAWSIGWLDLGWQIDTTAMGVLVWESRERRLITGVRILETPVDEAEIVAGLVELQREFSPIGWVYDPNAGGRQMAQLLDKGEHPLQDGTEVQFFEHSQDNAPMALASARFDEALRNGWLRHNGHEGLRRHVLNAVRRPLGGEKWRYDRPPDARHGERRGKYPNDALIGVVMGHSVAVGEHERPQHARASW
jgi:phage terminase large subunit-like protein